MFAWDIATHYPDDGEQGSSGGTRAWAETLD
jgi:hypothetical protein